MAFRGVSFLLPNYPSMIKIVSVYFTFALIRGRLRVLTKFTYKLGCNHQLKGIDSFFKLSVCYLRTSTENIHTANLHHSTSDISKDFNLVRRRSARFFQEKGTSISPLCQRAQKAGRLAKNLRYVFQNEQESFETTGANTSGRLRIYKCLCYHDQIPWHIKDRI